MPSLYRKWRPKTWDEIVGQDAVVRTLRQAVQSGRISHAYLFAGPRGTGKTTTARVLAKALNCLHPDPTARPCGTCAHCEAIQEGRFLDLIEMDAASHTGVDDVRALRETVHFAPTQGRYKVYIIDEVHMLSTAAFNALLKTLEEPPEHVVFVLATTEWHKVPATVRSRCQTYPFRRIPFRTIVDALKGIVQAEGLEVEPEALRAIAREAAGSLRDALSLLDQLAALGEPITLEHVQDLLGTAPDEAVYHIVQALQEGKPDAALHWMAQTVERGTEPRVLARQIVAYLRQIMLAQMGAEDLLETSDVWKERAQHHAQVLSVTTITRWIRLFQRAASALGFSWYPTLPLELALLEALYGETPQPTAAVASVQGVLPQKTAAAPASVPASPGPKAPADGETEEISFAHVQRAWPQVKQWLTQMAEVRKVPDLPGLLSKVYLVGVRGNTLLLAVPGDRYRNHFTREPYQSLWQEAWTRVLGRPVQLQWQVGVQAIQTSGTSPLVEKVIELGGQVQQFVPSDSSSETSPEDSLRPT